MLFVKMHLWSHPFRQKQSAVSVVISIHEEVLNCWALLMQKFPVINPTLFFMALYLSAHLCETASCSLLAISSFFASSAQKRTDTIIKRILFLWLLGLATAHVHICSHRLYLCWPLSKLSSVTAEGSSERSSYE